jgi:hypothetical protein
MSAIADELRRPYLVIPKLIEQPTWGGHYIAGVKGWVHLHNLDSLKIGQSYELFSGSNLSFLDSSLDPLFFGEITDRDTVQAPTKPDNALSLDELTSKAPEEVLGNEVVAFRGPRINILIKYTQALGNSFQVHMKSNATHPKWRPKPESWYYFERGLVTLGAKPGVDWDAYEKASVAIDEGMKKLGEKVSLKELGFGEAKNKAAQLIEAHDPWQFVNLVIVEKDQLIDMSGGGIHHSWEEDAAALPFGNVLYEIQSEAMDNISTFRNFDKGKMEADGTVRQLRINEYFEFIDRSPEANDPASHIAHSRVIKQNGTYKLELLLESAFYNMDKLTIFEKGSSFASAIKGYKHLFVKSGSARISTDAHGVTVTTGHSCFVPAAAGQYRIDSLDDNVEIIICY